ncbi:unnamed protein product [Eretmochelys imbricata]
MKHLAISNWLTQLGLPEYCMLFDKQYDGVEDLLHLTEVDLMKMGIENQIHRTHILSNILLLQEAERKRANGQLLVTKIFISEWGQISSLELLCCLPKTYPRDGPLC